MKALITRKIGMTSAINDNGALQAITLLSSEPNVITQVKSIEKDGYNAVQLGADRTKNLGKSLAGHMKKAKVQNKVLREFAIDELSEDLSVGTEIKADVFSVGDKVHAVGISKGKGFAGTIKRHNFHRGRKTHGGQSYRRPGSIGSMYPQKIFKGKKMAGRMGHERVTVRNLTIALVDADKNVIGVVGAIPGPRQGLVLIRGAE
jgi:large subunit ribosomal protein L3